MEILKRNSILAPVLALKLPLTLALLSLLLTCSSRSAVLTVLPASGGAGIQAALDQLSSGGEAHLSAGIYLVRQPVFLRRDHQTLRGDGPATVLYLADGANCPVIVLGSPLDAAKVQDIRLADLSIDGNRTNQQKEVWRFLSDGAGLYNNGVDVWGVDGAAVEHVICHRCRSGGLVSSGRTRHLTVLDYTAFDNQFDGLACYFTEDSDFGCLNLHDNLSAGISLDLNFDHNVVHDSVITGNDLGIFMRQSKNNVFKGLTIQKSRHDGVFMAQTFAGTAAGWHPCPGSECTGNTFDNLIVAHCGGKGFLVNDVTCTNNVISGGQFTDDLQGGLTQIAPNLVTLRSLAEPNNPAPLAVVMPMVRPAPARSVLAQTALKTL